MEKSGVCSDSAKQAQERRASLDRKTKCMKVPKTVTELLAELASLRLQTPEFFVRERGLCGKGLNPKLAVDMACVTPEKIEEVWGKCTSFKTTSTTLNPKTRRDLLQLYSKIYGKIEVTNNKFMTWLVKGYIAEHMGYQIDWASVAASTSFVLASRLEGELLRRDLSEEEASEFHHMLPRAVLKLLGSQSKSSGLVIAPMDHPWHPSKQKAGAGFCFPPALSSEVASAEEVLKVEGELLLNTESKEWFLEASKKHISERIIGFKFGMEDRVADAKEAAENVLALEGAFHKIEDDILDTKRIMSLIVYYTSGILCCFDVQFL
jgi:hypothetical protein